VLGASRRHVSAVVVVAIIVGTAATTGLVVAAPAAVAVAFLFVIPLGGPEEPEGVSGYRVIAARGGADLLFRGGIGSISREVVVAGAVEDATAAVRLDVVVLAAAAAALFLAVLLGGPEEPEGVSGHRVVVRGGGGVNFLF